MTQKEANKIFETGLGTQLETFYSTADGMFFIRFNEAAFHVTDMINAVGGQEYVDTTIKQWFRE